MKFCYHNGLLYDSCAVVLTCTYETHASILLKSHHMVSFVVLLSNPVIAFWQQKSYNFHTHTLARHDGASKVVSHHPYCIVSACVTSDAARRGRIAVAARRADRHRRAAAARRQQQRRAQGPRRAAAVPATQVQHQRPQSPPPSREYRPSARSDISPSL